MQGKKQYMTRPTRKNLKVKHPRETHTKFRKLSTLKIEPERERETECFESQPPTYNERDRKIRKSNHDTPYRESATKRFESKTPTIYSERETH